MGIRIIFRSFLIFAAVLFVSCTRPSTQQASFQLQLPADLRANKVGTMSATDLTHLIINITGPGISSPVFYTWDSHEGILTPPTSFTLDVPAGNDRLVQVLAVYRVSGTADEELFYGDKTGISTLTNSSATVAVTSITPDGISIGQGRISGRYVNHSSGSGPTGKITMRYTPAGRPSMILERTEIIGGYFTVFALQGVSFDYVLDNGVNMFGGPVNLDTVDTTTAAVVSFPQLWESQNNGTTFEERAETISIFGWFAHPTDTAAKTAIAAKSVCYADSPAEPDLRGVYTDSGGSSPAEWLTDVLVTNGIDDPQPEDGEQLCEVDGDARFIDYLSIDHMALGHGDGGLAFKGPYRLSHKANTNYRQTLDVGYSDANGLRVKWAYVPGAVTEGSRKAVDGSDIFWRPRLTSDSNYDEEYRVNDGIACGSLGAYGFQLLRTEPALYSSLAEDVTIATASLPPAFGQAFTDGRVDIVICPYSSAILGKNYFQSGDSFHSYVGGNPATMYEFVKIAGDPLSDNYIANNVCTPFVIRGADGYLPTLDATISYDDSEFELYNDPDCVTPDLNLYWSIDGYVVYIKRTNTGALTSPLNIEDNLGEIEDLDLDLEFINMPGGAVEQAKVLAQTMIKKHSCYPLTILIRDGADATDPIIMPASDDYVFTWPTLASVTYHDDPNCASTALSAPVTTDLYTDQSMSYFPVYFKYTGTSSSLLISPTVDNALPAGLLGATMSVSAPGAPRRLSLQLPLETSYNSCIDFYMQLQDNYGFTSPATVNFTATLTTSEGTSDVYLPNAGSCVCGGGDVISAPITFAAGTAVKHLCYKNTDNTTDEVSVTGSHGSTNVGSMTTIQSL